MITVGLDLSLAKTGYAIIKEDGTVLASGVIKSKPNGDKPIDEARRIVKIAEDVVQKIDELLPLEEPVMVAIENLAFMARNTTALVQLAGLNYLVRILLSEFKWPWVVIAPSSLKKFITGKGNADKNQVMMIIYKDYGIESEDDNTADAYALAVLALAMMDHPLRKITAPQAEVLALAKKQLWDD